MVAATLSGNTRKATKLKNAAQTTAARGDSTRVDTTVAMELAASCMPLRKSKTKAKAINTQITRGRGASNIAQLPLMTISETTCEACLQASTVSSSQAYSSRHLMRLSRS